MAEMPTWCSAGTPVGIRYGRFRHARIAVQRGSFRSPRRGDGRKDRVEPVFCLEPHDLAAAKLQAGRPKDISLLRALLETHRLNAALVRERLRLLRLDEAAMVAIHRRWRELEQSGER